MSSVPKVSVILPTYNRAEVLPRAIGSVIGQSFANFELILVDDASTDNTEQTISRFTDSRIRRLRQATNGGVAAARNHGASQAQGEWLAFLDSDDEWMPDALEVQLKRAEQNPEACLLAGASLRIDKPLVSNYCWPQTDERASGSPVDCARWMAQGIANFQSVMLRRRLFEKLGGFDPSLAALEDADLAYRVLQDCGDRAFAHRHPIALLHATRGSLISAPDRVLVSLRRLTRQNDWVREFSRPAYAAMLYRLALHETMHGDFGSARRLSRQAVSHHPTYWRYWAYTLLALSGPGITRSVRAVSQLTRSALFPSGSTP